MIQHPTPGHIARQNYNSKRYMHYYIHRSTIHIGQEIYYNVYIYIHIYIMFIYTYYIYIHTHILLSHKKELNNAICSNMDATRDYHTKSSQKEKDKYHMRPLYVESKI